VQVVLAVRKIAFRKPADCAGSAIATELLSTTKRIQKQENPGDVEFRGARPSKAARLVDAIVDITETGSSLRANRLRVIDVLMETMTILIANKTSWKTRQSVNKLENITILLQGTLNAERFAGLKCNVRKSDLKRVLTVLPALHNPTVSTLSDEKCAQWKPFIHVDEIKKIIRCSSAQAQRHR